MDGTTTALVTTLAGIGVTVVIAGVGGLLKLIFSVMAEQRRHREEFLEFRGRTRALEEMVREVNRVRLHRALDAFERDGD